jgi:hypothetical protein
MLFVAGGVFTVANAFILGELIRAHQLQPLLGEQEKAFSNASSRHNIALGSSNLDMSRGSATRARSQQKNKSL